MLVGASQLLTARVTSRGTPVSGVTPTWSTSDGTILSVNATGQVTALARGTATVSASVGALKGSVTLTVLGVRAVVVQPATLSLPVGNSQPLTANIDADAGVTAPTVTWTSGNPSVAAVSATGVVTGIAIGSATITATSQGRSGTATVSVLPPTTVSSVQILPSSAVLAVGGTQQLNATARDSAGSVITGRSVIWSSANLAVAQVSATGLVTGVAPGTTNVTATVDGRTAAASVVVQGPVTSLAVSPATSTIALGGTQAFIATAKDALGQVVTGRPVTWAVANATVATISSQGVVTGVAPGTTTITATSEGQRATASVTVEGLGGLPPTTIGAGIEHSCAILSNARVACWGDASFGGLGTGQYGRRPDPIVISGDHAMATLSNGTWHSCGITTTGKLFCWGRNQEGQIGDGTLTNRLAPVAVVPTQTFKAVAAGQFHTCAVTTAGAALCWGQNSNGELGDGTTTNRPTPGAVAGSQTFIGITAATHHSCAWTEAGQASCWGSNAAGGLGDGTTTSRRTPTSVMGGQIFVEVVARGAHSCGRTVPGAVFCWGSGADGQLGTGTFPAAQTAPARVSGTTTFTRLSAGGGFTCGLASDGTAHCWGRNASGELGDGTSTRRATPAPVSGLRQVVAIGAGSQHACAIDASGTASCWGRNNYAQRGEWDVVRTPTTVAGLSNATQVTGGYFNSCMLSSSGTTTCWGLGLESPTANAVGKTFSSIEHGDAYVCGLDAARSAWCWGVNNAGKLGIGTEEYQANPQAVLGGQQYLKLSGYYTHACGINVSNAMWCWGANPVGQIDDSGINRLVPTAINTGFRFTDVAVGAFYSCALATSRNMYCWGNQVSGSSALVQVLSAHTFTSISVNGNPYFCGIRADKQVVCASSATDATGRVIEGLSNAERLEGFVNTTCAITTDRSVYCWGENTFGQLGDPTVLATSSWTRAVRVSGISTAVSIGGSYDTPCAALGNGTVSCWGFNANGEAGQPAPRVPRPVIGGLTFKGP
jgi:alpha-tubulin suppressor-like RCC1 family protein/uncharacterized protein YjdB